MAGSRSRAFGSVLLGPPDQSPGALRIRVQLLLTLLLVGTNVIGAGIVVALTTLVIPGPQPDRHLWLALAVAVPAYVGLAVVVGLTWGTAASLRALRWATEDR